MELKVVDQNAYYFAEALVHNANEQAESNRLKRCEIRLRIMELKAYGKHFSELDTEALQTLMQEAGQDGAT